MKDPETIRRLELISRGEVALAMAKHALEVATRDIGLVVPQDHPLAKALSDARLAFAKADVLNAQLLRSLK